MRLAVFASLVAVFLVGSTLSAQPYDFVVAGPLENACRVGAIVDDSILLQWIVNGARGTGRTAGSVVAPASGGRVIAAIESGDTFHVDFVSADGSAQRIGTAPAGYRPLSMAAGDTGAIYVVAHLATDVHQRAIIAFGPTGAVTGVHPLALPDANGIDLAADQCTLFIAAGDRVARFNVCTATPLSDFAAGTGIFAVRILPDGGALVLRVGQAPLRYSAAGAVTQTYPSATDKGLTAITLADGGTRAVAPTRCMEEIWAIDLGSAAVTRLGFDLYELELPRSIVPYAAWTAALGAAHLPTAPTASTTALALLGAMLAVAAVLRMR